jgi:putative hemolysin
MVSSSIMVELILVGSFFFLLILSALFSGTETAYTAISESEVADDGTSDDRRRALVRDLIRQKGRIIAALLIGNNIVNTVLPVLATVLLGDLLSQVPVIPLWAAPILAAAITICFLLIFGEVIPKNLAVLTSKRWALAVARPVSLLIRLFSPAIALLDVLSGWVSGLFAEVPGMKKPRGLQDLMWLTRVSQQSGTIDDLEAKLINRSSVLNDHDIREIMIPRMEICMTAATTPIAEIRALFAREMYSRIPVFAESSDSIVGILHFKQVFALGEDMLAAEAAQIMQAPFFVPATRSIGSLLEEMRRNGEHLAVAIDEFGTSIGIVTLEDVLEFLVGAIRDEFDPRPAQGSDASRPNTGPRPDRFEISGRLPVFQFERETGLSLRPDQVGEATTMAGLFLHHAGAIPRVGDEIQLEPFTMRVLRLATHRIERFEIIRR